MKNNLIITIGRQYGSGGREIGSRLAERLGIGYYDKELIAEAARKSGLSGDMFERNDERALGRLLHALSTGFSFRSGFSPESIFKIQSDTIKDVASKGPCVIIGRCADYVLRDNPMCISIFITGDDTDRLARVMRRNAIDEKEAAERIAKTDKGRAAYYEFYTGKTWGAAPSYDLCINSSVLGIEATAEGIADFVSKVTAAK